MVPVAQPGRHQKKVKKGSPSLACQSNSAFRFCQSLQLVKTKLEGYSSFPDQMKCKSKELENVLRNQWCTVKKKDSNQPLLLWHTNMAAKLMSFESQRIVCIRSIGTVKEHTYLKPFR